jgi:hypothetical protein
VTVPLIDDVSEGVFSVPDLPVNLGLKLVTKPKIDKEHDYLLGILFANLDDHFQNCDARFVPRPTSLHRFIYIID